MFALNKIRPHIYALTFDSRYDLAMHFLRAQEFYESPRFKGQRFSIPEYMEWYAKEGPGKSTGSFSYPSDWKGFNVPSAQLIQLYFGGPGLPDDNIYDHFMRGVIRLVHAAEGEHDFYLLGARTGDEATMDHEIAHGMFYVDREYNSRVKGLLRQMDQGLREDLEGILLLMGYHPSVFADEVNAYLSTGLCDEMKLKGTEWSATQPEPETALARQRIPFQELYEKFEGRDSAGTG